MRRLTVEHEIVTADTSGALVAPDGTIYLIAGEPSGLDQIADFACDLARELDEHVVYFEIFWPWETEESQTWDAVRVDVAKLGRRDPEDWWITTLPPYADLSPEERKQLEIEGDYA